MSSKSKYTFTLLLVVISIFALLSIACDDSDGSTLTINKIVEGEKQNWSEIGDSLKIKPKINVWGEATAEALCVAQGGQWSSAINACKK